MDRINGADFVNIGNGKRGFKDQNAVAGVAGTEVTADFLNSVQEEILTVIEKAGLKADAKNWAQLWDALNQLNLPGFRGRHFWHAIKAMDVNAPPNNSAVGDAYLIPTNATGVWASQKNKIAIKDETSWIYITPQDGHGIGLPDGRVFNKVNGQYVEVLASRNYVETRRMPTRQMVNYPCITVKEVNVITPPDSPTLGDTYVIAPNATGIWAGKNLQVVEWDGTAWNYFFANDGHSVVTPDGKFYIRVNRQYIEKIALDSQSGKWNYAEAQGTANILSATLELQPSSLSVGLTTWIKMKVTNTGAVTLNLNRLGTRPIVYHETGEPLVGDDFQSGDVVNLVYDGTSWRLQPSLSYMDKRYSRLTAPPTDTYYVLPTGNDNNTGFSATAAAGFKTIEGAIKSITERYMTSKTIKLIVSPGNYDGFTIPPSFIGGWRITGNPAAPQNVIIDSTKSTSKYVRGANISTDGVIIEGMTLGALNECVYYTGGGNLRIKDCNLILGGTNATGVTSYNGNIALAGTIKMTGSGLAAIYARKGEIRLGVTELEDVQTTRIEYNCSVSMGNFLSTASGLIYLNPNLTTLTGTCNGRRFHAHTNGVIALNGTNGNFIPGTYDGVAFTGGIVT